MKIGIAHKTIQNGYGIERRILSLSDQFASLGHRVTLIAHEFKILPRRGQSRITIGDARSDMTPEDVYRATLPHLRDFDVVHTHYYPMVIAGSLANEKFGTPHVFTYHGITDPHFFRSKTRKLKRVKEAHALDTAFNGISTVITPTRYLAQDFTARFGAKQTCVIPNGVDLGRFSPSASGKRIREKFGLENTPLILYLGRITPHKGVTTLCEVMDQVVNAVPNAKLLVAGKDETGFFSKQIQNHRPPYLVYAGFVPESEIVDYYSACDVYCSASLWEGFGMTFIEAMACGKPVVGFQTCAIPEVVKDGEVGRLVKERDVNEMADVLVELLTDPETRRTMGRAARKYVEDRYDWREIARRVLDEYAVLCKG